MRKLFMTDVHGEYEGMMRLLEHAAFDPAVDQLVFGGDMVSCGPDSGAVLREVRRLVEQYPGRVAAVIGNHEEMMAWYFAGVSTMWRHHTGAHTLPNLHKTFKTEEQIRDYVDWAASLPLIWNDEEYVYTHAGLDPQQPLHAQDRDVLWMEENMFYSYPRERILACTEGRPVVHGHTPCEYIYSDGARINCDLGSHTYTVRDEQAVGLVDLTNETYGVYKIHTKQVQHRNITRFA